MRWSVAALHWSLLVGTALNMSQYGAETPPLTLYAPVFVEWSTPDPKVQDLHEDEAKGDIDSERFDGDMLSSSEREARVHDENARLARPDRHDLTLLYHQYELAAVSASRHLRGSQRRNVESWRQEVGLGHGDDIDRHNERCIEADAHKHHCIIYLQVARRAKGKRSRGAVEACQHLPIRCCEES